MKSLLYKILLFSLPVLFLIVFTNYFGDAANIFSRDYEKEIARIIGEGNHVTNISNFDERLLQEELITNLEYSPDIVIIGSSRSMQLNKDFFPGHHIINNSVSGASLEDLIAIYQIYKENDKLPEQMFLGIDPWTFQKDDKRARWKSIESYYNSFFNKNDQANHFPYKQLISLSYFQNSLKLLPQKITGNNKPVSTHNFKNIGITRLNDGSIVYGKNRRNVSVEEVRKSARLWIGNGMITRYENFHTISQDKWKEFEIFINEIDKKEIKINFILSPFHPMVYEEMVRKFDVIEVLESEIRTYANNNNIEIIGSFNPEVFDLKEKDFNDETHPKDIGMRKIFNR